MSSWRSCGVVALAACAALSSLSLMAGAARYSVGGDGGWAVPGAGAESYNAWAEKTSFQIGDQLLFVYPKDSDSVLLVEPADYNACNVSSYDQRFADGSTAFALDRSGAFFFISGVEANCRANEKLIVMVSAAAKAAPAPTQGSTTTPAAATAPPPSGDAAATTTKASPPPSPPSSSSPNPPAAAAKNSTAKGGAPPDTANGAAAGLTAAGRLAGSLAACIGFAMVAI